MAIPLHNIYYLLCYAYGHAQDVATVPLGAELGERTENLFAHILSTGARRLIKRGLARRYLLRAEEMRGLRGKVQLGNTVARSLLRRGELSCEYEELSFDLLENQILKSAIAWLSHHPQLASEYRRALVECRRQLGEVNDLPFFSIRFDDLKISPPRADYSLVLGVAELMQQGALPLPQGDGSSFVPFERDEARMGTLFEDFATGFVRIELPEVKLGPRGASWQVEAHPADLQVLPALQRDLVLNRAGERTIVECKFYASPLALTQYGSHKLRSGHLYQLLAYLMNDLPTTRGVLLYASAGATLRHDYELVGRSIAVRSVNLDQAWTGIRQELLGILVG